MKLDPRTKLVMVICLSTLAVIYNSPKQMLLLFAASIMLLLVFQVQLDSVWWYLRRLLPLLLILFLIQSFFSSGGRLLWAAGPIPLLTTRGLELGAAVVLRMGVIFAAALLLTTSNSRDFVLGLVQWKIPYEIAFMVSIAIRFLPVFREEMTNVVTAIQLRGIDLRNVPWGQKLDLYRRLFIPVVYATIIKARQLAVAMEARGFRAYPSRTYLRRLHFSWADYSLILLSFSATLILIGLEVTLKTKSVL